MNSISKSFNKIFGFAPFNDLYVLFFSCIKSLKSLPMANKAIMSKKINYTKTKARGKNVSHTWAILQKIQLTEVQPTKKQIFNCTVNNIFLF